MKVALYARVSLDETDPEKKRYQEPDNQIKPMQEFCNSMGWDIKFIFIDRVSGGDSNRPEFQRMMAEARQHHFDLVMIWKLDRFSREGILNTLKYLEDLKQHNVKIKSLTESWLDTRDPHFAELILSIMSWIAAEEKKKISERTKAGIQRRKNLGIWKGGRPVGSKDSKPRQRGATFSIV